MSFENKVVIVTGSSSGIGAVIAETFAGHKANVVLVGRNVDNLKKVAEKCEKLGAKSLTVVADMGKDDDVKTIIDKTIEQFGKIDVLVNNAGIMRVGSILDGNVVKVYDEVMKINMRSALVMTTLAGPYLVKTKGCIINISSAASGFVFADEYLPYSLSKTALDYFTRAASMEFAKHGVRVNSVQPGPVRTNILDHAFENVDETWELYVRNTALNRFSTPDEISDMVFYLASDKARGITGAIIKVDNGVRIGNQ